MTARQALSELLDRLPEERLAEILDFARAVAENDERKDWQRFGKSQLARAYGSDEPEYSKADLKRERRG
jgi:hypothetical protein